MAKKNIILITGITATGKTTIAKKLSKYLKLPLVSVDQAYSIIGRELKFKEPAKLVMPEQWEKFPNFKELKMKAYKYLLDTFCSLPKNSDAIFEGFTLFFKEDREILINLTKPDWVTIFKLDIPITQWIKLRKQKHGTAPDKQGYIILNKYFQEPDHYYSIIDPEMLIVHRVEYQKKGFTDEKWRRLKLTPDQLKGKSVVDLGCNTGWMCDYSKNYGAKRVLGIDRNWRYLENARKLGAEVKLMNLEKIHTLREKFDISLCLSTLHYIEDKEKFIRNVSQITNEIFILELPILQEKGFRIEERKNHSVPTKDLVIKWLSKYFTRCVVVGESIPPDDSYRLVFKAYK